MSNGGKAKWCARQSGVVRGEEDAWRVAVELPSAELQRGREMANCRRRDSSRLRRHESSPPAVQAVWNGRGKPLSLTAPRWRAISWCQCASVRGVKEEGVHKHGIGHAQKSPTWLTVSGDWYQLVW